MASQSLGGQSGCRACRLPGGHAVGNLARGRLGNVCRRDAASRDHKIVDLLGQQAVIGNLVGRWGWKVGLFVVIYPLIYFGFGFLPWSSAAVRESYATWALTNEPVAVLLAFNA
jgi:hypothetical protein